MSDRAKLYYYKRNPSDALAGMARLTLEQRGAYNTLLDLMYQNGGALDHDERFLMHQLGCSLRKCKALIGELLTLGKIYLTDDGRIGNERVDQEVGKASGARDVTNSAQKTTPKTPRKHAENAVKTARKSSEKRENTNEINKSDAENELYARALQLEYIVIDRDKEDVSNETSYVGSGDFEGGLFAQEAPAQPPAKAKRKRAYTPAFGEFWREYPTTSNMSKWAAFRNFDALSAEDQQLAIRGASAYASEVKRRAVPADKIKHAQGWLSDRRFETATDPDLRAQTEQRALVVAGSGGEKATLRDKMNFLARWAEEKENARR